MQLTKSFLAFGQIASAKMVHQVIYLVVTVTFLICGSFFATTDSAYGQIKKPAKEGKFVSNCTASEKLSEDEAQKLIKKILDCWKPPYGVVGQKQKKLVVTVGFELSIDGKLVGEPKVIAKSNPDHKLTEKATKSIHSAFRKCQPFKLNPMKYECWKYLRVNVELVNSW